MLPWTSAGALPLSADGSAAPFRWPAEPVYIPAGFAHGFVALTERVQFLISAAILMIPQMSAESYGTTRTQYFLGNGESFDLGKRCEESNAFLCLT